MSGKIGEFSLAVAEMQVRFMVTERLQVES